MDKAKQKALEREAEREKIAAELQELHFRINCDPLRTLQSQQRLLSVVEQQKQQACSL